MRTTSFVGRRASQKSCACTAQGIELSGIRDLILPSHHGDERSSSVVSVHILGRLGAGEMREVLEGADIVAKHLGAILQTS